MLWPKQMVSPDSLKNPCPNIDHHRHDTLGGPQQVDDLSLLWSMKVPHWQTVSKLLAQFLQVVCQLDYDRAWLMWPQYLQPVIRQKNWTYKHTGLTNIVLYFCAGLALDKSTGKNILGEGFWCDMFSNTVVSVTQLVSYLVGLSLYQCEERAACATTPAHRSKLAPILCTRD